LSIVLPWPPSANKYWRYVGGRVLVSQEAKDYKSIVYGIFLESKLKTIHSRISVCIYLYPPDKRKFDIDNRIKVLADALEYAGFFENDSQIDKLYVERRESKTGGEVCVTISQIEKI